MPLELEYLQRRHIDELIPRFRAQEAAWMWTDNPPEDEIKTRLLDLMARGPALVGTEGGRIAWGIAGIAIYWPGVGEGWTALTPDAIQKWSARQFSRTFRDGIEKLMIEHGIWRVQATPDCEDPIAVRFARHLGMQAEGVMRAYSPLGHDCLMMALVR